MIAHPPLACSWLGCCERALADNNNKSALSQGHDLPSGRALGAGIGFWLGSCVRGLAAPGAALVLAADFRTSSGMVRGGCALFGRALSSMGRT